MADRKTPFQILRGRYPENEYVLMAEVANSTGGPGARSIDFVVMSLWPSRGLFLTGIERKSSRSDWLRELKDPKKQELHFRFFDYFYLLTDNEGVTKPEEIPATWGWLHVDTGGKVKTMKEAPKLHPEILTRGFLAALLRRASSKEGFILKEEISEQIEQAKKSGSELREWEVKRFNDEISALKANIKSFEDASGLKIPMDKYHTWNDNPKQMGQWVKWLMQNDPNTLQAQLNHIKVQAEKIIASVNQGIELTKQP